MATTTGAMTILPYLFVTFVYRIKRVKHIIKLHANHVIANDLE